MAILFIADTHLNYDEGKRIEAFLSFLDFVGQRGDTIYILGDLFNFWIGCSQGRLSPFQRIVRGLEKHASQVSFIPGNRDFLFAHDWHKKGGCSLEDGALITVDQHRVALYHGDIFCTKDLNYQRMKVFFQSRFIYHLSRFFPSFLCLHIGRKLRQASQRAIERKDFDQMDVQIEEIERRSALAQADVLICGHHHIKRILSLTKGKRNSTLYVLPENTGCRFEYLKFENRQFVFETFDASTPSR